ncbi:hypothetical protein [Thioalkalivibrio sp.]|uniref:hypothetical protein n=1 Tax=Thioalkalivibrio sp. TaxID=2093813 RepID=UPI0035684F74
MDEVAVEYVIMPRKIGENSAEAATKAVETEEELKDSSTVLEGAADAVGDAVEASAEAVSGLPAAIRDGASDARRAAAEVLPAIGAMAQKGVYNGFYFGTYGVVFGTLVVSRFVPGNNTVGQGIRDGAVAARQAFETHEHAAHSKPADGL